MAAARGAGRPGGAVGQHGADQHRLRRRGAVPVGRAPGVVALAARHPDSGLSGLLLRRPGDLPADRRPRRQPRRAGRGADAVAGLHARGDGLRLGHGDPAARRRAGRVLRRRHVRRARADAAPRLVRDLRRGRPAAGGRGDLVRGRGPERPAGDAVDDRGRDSARAGQRDEVRDRPVRPHRGRRRVPELVAGGRVAAGPAARGRAGRGRGGRSSGCCSRWAGPAI